MDSIDPIAVDDWLSDWDRQLQPQKQDPYVQGELAKLRERGVPLLYAALRLGLPEQIDACVRVLRTEMGYATVYLRLHPKATPWDTDLDGKIIPESERGKVQYCKVGVVGQTPDGRPNPEGTHWETTGPGRIARERSGRSNQRAIKIGRQPTAVPIDQAIAILRSRGVGIVTPGRIRRGPDGAELPGQRSNWLIEEVPQVDGQPVVRPDVTKPESTKKPTA